MTVASRAAPRFAEPRQFLPRHWWQHILHNQTALLVKGALLFRKNTVVADVPYLLKR